MPLNVLSSHKQLVPIQSGASGHHLSWFRANVVGTLLHLGIKSDLLVALALLLANELAVSVAAADGSDLVTPQTIDPAAPSLLSSMKDG